MNLLLLSNSTNYGEPYLHHAKSIIGEFASAISTALFIPYAGVTVTYDDYEKKVQAGLSNTSLQITSIHHFEDPKKAVAESEAIIVGGGNTFQLLAMLQDLDLVDEIKLKVHSGTPYIGWSAGSNIAGPTIRTTNDMPIVEPSSFKALCLVPFQINPHYTNKTIPNHGGETRMDRLKEFLMCNKTESVCCMPEGTWIMLTQNVCSVGGVEDILDIGFDREPKIVDNRYYQHHFLI